MQFSDGGSSDCVTITMSRVEAKQLARDLVTVNDGAGQDDVDCIEELNSALHRLAAFRWHMENA